MGTVTHAFETLHILGIPLSVLTSYEQAVELVVERVGRCEKTFCVAINPEKIHRAQTDDELGALINQADLHICDGVGAAIAARLLYNKRIARVTGVQLFLDLIAAAEKNGLGVFLLGASDEVNHDASRRLLEKRPHLKIVDRQNGYFQDDQDVVERINRSGADMLFVAMGSPRQERWISKHRDSIRAPFCMGIGGTLDVVSGRVPWAPAICRKTGTEFLYRLVREPKRWKRQLSLPLFMMDVLRAALFGEPVAEQTVRMPARGRRDDIHVPKKAA